MHRFALFLLVACPAAVAGEYAVLTNGARVHVDRHEVSGQKVRLYHAEGFIEMDPAAVTAFEPDGIIPKEVQAPVAIEPPVPQVAESPKPLSPLELADAAAAKYGLPASLVRSVMAAESGFQPNAVSPKGAIGLMQLMPETAQMLGVDPYDPAQNVDGGTRHLRDLLLKYDGAVWHALAAYNAGPGAVEKYNGIPPYRETIHYIGAIQRKWEKAEAAAR